MDLVSRVQAILLKPKEEWVKIKAETSTVAELFTSYAVILAAIPAVATFIQVSLIGQRVPIIGWVRIGIGRGLAQAILTYVLTLVSVYVSALVINALAPTFSSTPNQINALKLVVYSMTPGWVAGVLNIIPYLGILAMLAGLYGLYILYLGFLTPMMDTPKEKVMSYFIISLVVVLVLYVVVFLVLGAIFAVGGVYRPL
jgi:hypothetical protein